ncbi:unnamed protein product [Ectocarpus sp. CCAP 1310/34]|nr:unnamed protein product [Ectocarpus sp. CCAP 1310/34]
MFSVHTTPEKPRVRQPKRSSPQIRDRRGTKVDVASLSPTSSPASGLNSPQTGGVASSASRRTSPRTPKRTSAPDVEGYETKYVKPVPQRFSRAAGGKDGGGGGGSYGSPLLVSSSQGSGDSDEAEGESSPVTGGSSEGGGGKGKEPERRNPGPEVKRSGNETGPRWWTQQGERELLWRLIPKHLASKHSATKAKDEEWWKCAQALSKKVEMTMRVKEVQKDGNVELVTKKVTVDMGRKMEVIVEKLSSIFSAHQTAWNKRQEKKKSLTGEGDDGDDEGTEAEALEQASIAWEAGLVEKASKDNTKQEHTAAANRTRDKAKEHHARSMQSTSGVGASAKSTNGKGKAKEKGRGAVRDQDQVTPKRARSSTEPPALTLDLNDGAGGSDESDSCSSRQGSWRRSAVSVDDSSDDDEETNVMDQAALDLACGRGGRSTRDGKGGGKRRRKVQPLSSGMGGDPVLNQIMDLLHSKARAGSGGHGEGPPPMTEGRVCAIVDERVAAAVAAGMRRYEAERQQQHQQQWQQRQPQPQPSPFYAPTGAFPLAHGAASGVAPAGMPGPSVGVHSTIWPGTTAGGGAAVGMAQGGVGMSAAGGASHGHSFAAPREGKTGISEAQEVRGGASSSLPGVSGADPPPSAPSTRPPNCQCGQAARRVGPVTADGAANGTISWMCAKADRNQQCNFFELISRPGGGSTSTGRNNSGMGGGGTLSRGGTDGRSVGGMRVGQETFADRLSAITSNFPISTWSWTSVSTTGPSSISRSKPPPTTSLLETWRQLALHEDTMSSGNVELVGDNVEILDYEPEGEAPTAEQFPAAGAVDESPPMFMVFTVDELLDNIATADPAELERAYNNGRVSLEDIVEAAHLSSDSPLFVPPFSLPPEDRLIPLPHGEFMAYKG